MESDLSIMMTWMGGLLFAAAAVLSAQGLSRYVAIRTVEILATMDARRVGAAKDFSTALEAVAVQYVVAKVSSIQSRQAEKDVLEVTSIPTPFLMQPDHSKTG
jgi:hypothetical protein